MDKETFWSVVFVIAFLGCVFWFSSYKCSAKAEKMEAFQSSWGPIQGCMVKENPDSKWRDVQR